MKLLYFGLLNIFVLVWAEPSYAQHSTTYGRSSPIVGVKAKVDYISEKSVKLTIPPSLASYLTGLLLTNKVKSDTSSINQALTVWIRKYKELRVSINQVNDQSQRNSLLLQLDKGDFVTVENNLHLKTSYKSLSKTFPETYQTTGDQSPIVLGDYATVTYVVKEVINVGMDEGSVASIMKQIQMLTQKVDVQKNKLNSINSLTIDLPSVSSTVQNYIASYKLIKAELAKTPAAVFRRANKYFIKNDFKRVLKILDSASKNNDQEFAQVNVIKAKILILTKFEYPSLDSVINEINKSYLIAVQIQPNFENNFEYGKFLVETLGNYQDGKLYLEKALPQTSVVENKITIYNYLSVAYAQTDKIKSFNFLQTALDVVNQQEPNVDSTLLAQKALILNGMANAYSSSYYNREQINTGINYTNQAIASLKRIKNTGESVQFLNYNFHLTNGKQYYMIADMENAISNYQQSLDLILPLYKENPNKYLYALALVFYNFSEVYYTTRDYGKAITCLKKAKDIMKPAATFNNRFIGNSTIFVSFAIATNYTALKKTDSVVATLYELNTFIKPFIKGDSSSYNLAQAQVNTDLGEAYLTIDKPDSAGYFLAMGTNYFESNSSAMLLDKNRMMKCFNLYNTSFIRRQKFKEACNTNKRLLIKFNALAGLNKLGYEDFIPQFDSQLAEVYNGRKEKDSAIYYSNLAITLTEPKAKTYGVSYISAYNTYLIQACNIYLQNNEFTKADSISKVFITAYSDEICIDPFIKESYQGQVGDFICNFSNLFLTFSNEQKNNLVLKQSTNTFFEMIDNYYSYANAHITKAYSKDKNEGLRLGTFYLNYADFQQKWEAAVIDAREKEKHKTIRCNTLNKASALAVSLPNTIACNDFKKNILSTIASCN